MTNLPTQSRSARIGLQAYTVREEFDRIGPFETMARAAEAGYRIVELSHVRLDPSNVRELVRARDELGIEYCALSVSMDRTGSDDALDRDFAKIAQDAHELGSSMVRVGLPPVRALRSAESIVDFCADLEAAARRLADHGLELHYHHHHVEFARLDRRLVLDVISERAPSVMLELDVHWIHRGGHDPASVIETFGDRVRLVHLKDYRIGWLPDDAIEARVSGDRTTWRSAWNDVVQFAEVGEGSLDWSSILAASIRARAEFLLVEQDATYGRPVWESLAISRANLSGMGYAHLF